MSVNKQLYYLIIAMAVPICSFVSAEDSGGGGLRFDANGSFKVVQFTDIHFKQESPKSPEVLRIMTSILDAERPDLVILTGDIVTSRPVSTGWEAVVQPMITRNIPWAVTLGNHDDEHDLNREEIISLLEKLPSSLVDAGPADIEGEGNYILKIKSSHKKRKDAAVIYCLDSLAYAPLPEEENGKYGWMDPSQIQWYEKTSAQITKANRGRPFPALAFFHIPLPEYNDAWNNKSPVPIGIKGEEVCCPWKNTGMFAAMKAGKDVMGIFVGHDHDNDYAGCLDGICLAYGRATGLDTYGDLQKGGRVIELKEGKREFDTWLRTVDGKVHHKVHYPESFATER